MHPTVLIVAVLFLHGVSGHLFPRALPYELTKHMQLPKHLTRQSDVDQCVDNKLEEAFNINATLAAICEAAFLKAEIVIDNDDDDISQSDVNTVFGALCIPDCGNVYICAADDCGGFDGDDAPLKDFFIDMCGTNQNGDKCYQLYTDAIDSLTSEVRCYQDYVRYRECNCRSQLTQGIREHGCCLDIYHEIPRNYDPSDLYDVCNVDLPSGCNNSPITAGNSSITAGNSPTTYTADNSPTTADDNTTTEKSGYGMMIQVALVTLISALIFSVLLS